MCSKLISKSNFKKGKFLLSCQWNKHWFMITVKYNSETPKTLQDVEHWYSCDLLVSDTL